MVGIKTNLLYGALTLTPNIGAEIKLTPLSTLDLSMGYNFWRSNKGNSDKKKLTHFIIEPEYRRYLNEAFNGHFFGAHALYSFYNIRKHNLPMLFGKHSSSYRFQGYAIGAGVSYGYQLKMSSHWNMELEIGLGYAWMHYNKYCGGKCGDKIEEKHKNYLGPTKAAISVVYLIK